MFTGLVEGVGRVASTHRRDDGSLRLSIASSLPVAEMQRGESVAVSGVCLTAVELGEDTFGADVVPETLRRTTLGELAPQARVNLERSLRLGDRLGGHLVQGHVDATAPVVGVQRGGDYRLEIGWVPEIRPYVAMKGSIALAGVSLTVAALTERGFAVALVPETLERTTLGELEPGGRVNVEVDLLARYLERMLDAREAQTERPGGRPRGDHG